MRGRPLRRTLALAIGLLAFWPAAPAGAHPLGNFTVNQHSGLVVTSDAVEVTVVIDMAEIPAFQTRAELDTDHDRTVSPDEAAAFGRRACGALRDGVDLRLDGRPLVLATGPTEVVFPPGQAGLPTLRLTCSLRAPTGGVRTGMLEFRNGNYTDRVGWREITAVADAGVVVVGADVPARSASGVLRNYPQDLLTSPLDQRQAHVRITAGTARGEPHAGLAAADGAGPATGGPLPRGADRFTTAFTGLVARQRFTIWFGLLAVAAAVGLGALHALAPGHGKTVMAACLIGERGSLRQAAALGLSVTVSHTAGVLVLGLLLSGSTALVPERLYPWLGAASGGLLAAVGVSLLLRAWQRRSRDGALLLHHDHGPDHGHHDGPGHGHHHGPDDGHPSDHSPGQADPDRHNPREPRPVAYRTLLIMGAAGGMVPSPSALVVLLGAIALGRTWFGAALVLGYGLGMALTLVGAGFVLVRARGALDSRAQRPRVAPLLRALPVVTASFVVIAGLGLTARALEQL